MIINIYEDPIDQTAIASLVGICEALANTLQRFTCTALLDVSPLLTALAILPRLEELNLRTHCSSTFHEASTLPTPFRSLRRLIVATQEAYDLPRLLDSIQPHTKMTHLEYGIESGVDEDLECEGDIRDVLLAASRHPRLETIALGGFVGQVALSPAVLAPIHVLFSLHTLEVDVDSNVEMTDEDIRNLAANLPRLRTLHIAGNSDAPIVPSLGALEIIVALCPAIETISLALDNIIKPIPVSVGRASTSLTTVCMHKSPVVDLQAVAVFLSQISDAPRLRIRSDLWPEHEYQEKWKEVDRWLPALRKVALLREEKAGFEGALAYGG